MFRCGCLFLVLSLLLPVPVQGDSFRCGRALIRSGDSTAEVLRVCGEPLHKDSTRAVVQVNGAMKEVSVKRWHYRHNTRSRERQVLIYRGEVVGIEIGRN